MTSTAKVKTLLVSDLVDSTRWLDRVGDERAAEVIARHDRIAEHGGREIDKTDGFLILFDRPLHAVLYALDYHQALDTLGGEIGADLTSRVGIHLGDARRAVVGSETVERPLGWLARGAYRFKGVDEPTEVFEVGALGFDPLSRFAPKR